jgi:hypothetical protein
VSLIPVVVPCLHGHHDSHTVRIAPMVSLPGAIEAERMMFDIASGNGHAGKLTDRELTYAWAPVFVRDGVRDYDLCDEQGDALDFDPDVVVGDYRLARLVAEACNEAGYGAAILAPFLETQAKRSPTTPTTATTSQPVTRTRKRSGSR